MISGFVLVILLLSGHFMEFVLVVGEFEVVWGAHVWRPFN